MAKKPPPPEKGGDVPEWFMTYSDVITLLMTFFILLLTFATSEPEKFERMQVSLFSGGGGTGIVSDADGPLEKDSLLLRVRPRSSRVTTRGTETPPINADPELESVNKGLEGLDKELEHDMETSRAIMLPLPAMIDEEHNLTVFGVAMIRKFATHLGKGPFLVNFEVGKPDHLDRGIVLCEVLTQAARMPLGRIGTGVRVDAGQDPTLVRIAFTRIWNQN